MSSRRKRPSIPWALYFSAQYMTAETTTVVQKPPTRYHQPAVPPGGGFRFPRLSCFTVGMLIQDSSRPPSFTLRISDAPDQVFHACDQLRMGCGFGNVGHALLHSVGCVSAVDQERHAAFFEAVVEKRAVTVPQRVVQDTKVRRAPRAAARASGCSWSSVERRCVLEPE
jgi:hypothetical protein